MVSLVVNCGKTHIRHIDGESQTSSSREQEDIKKDLLGDDLRGSMSPKRQLQQHACM